MLAQINRLTEKKDYVRVQKLGKFCPGEFFGLGYFKRKDDLPTRFGYVVSKTVSPNASKRNYIKRALGESLRQNMYRVKNGYDCVIVVKPEASKKFMAELMNEVVKTLIATKIAK